METKCENLSNQNFKLKERITKINKSDWENNKFTENSYKCKENLNVTDPDQFQMLNCYDKSKKFNCYNCDKIYNSLNMLMNHKKKFHNARKKCRNVETCKFNQNCWYIHDKKNANDNESSDDNESVKTYYTT